MENEFYRCGHPVQGELNLDRGKARKARIAASLCPKCDLRRAEERARKHTYIDGRPLEGADLQHVLDKYTAGPKLRLRQSGGQT